MCARTALVDNRTEVVILQHPKEAFHPFGTVRFAKLGLARVRTVVPDHPRRAVRLALPPNAGVLYPSPHAVDIGRHPPPDLDALVVIDGTWPQARSLYRHNPWLAALPHYALSPAAPSAYRIRREPDERFLSTIEAIAGALAAIEPNTAGLPHLLGSFRSMIDDQVEYARTPVPRVLRRRRVGPRRLRLPDDLVIAHAEVTRDASGRSEVLLCAAVQVATGEVFQAYGCTEALEASDGLLLHMGLARRDVAGGFAQATLGARWVAFVGGRPHLCWSQSTVAAMHAMAPSIAPALMLKGAYCNALRRRAGALEAVVTRHALRPEAPRFDGRMGVVMAQLEAVVRWLLETEGRAVSV